ncbi:MAG: serine protease [Tannerella sp.]|nr:serine protease [Tannerella sp.]
MKNIFVVVLCLCGLSLQAQKDNPKWIENARKAVFTIEAFDANGKVRNGNGFFIQNTGEAVSDYTLFMGAVSAVVTDVDGRKMNVNNIIGADEVYDVIRFKVAVTRNVAFLPIASSMPATGVEAYLPQGKEPVKKGVIEEVTKIKNTFDYYKINIPLTSAQVSLPLLNANGEVFALTQADASGKNKTYGISVPYIQSLRISSLDILSKSLSAIGIRNAWSQDVEEAQLALLFYASQQNPSTYLETLNDFIATFPDLADGYLSRASHYARFKNELAQSQDDKTKIMGLIKEDLNTYLKKNPKEDEGLYGQAKLIYEVLLDDSTAVSNDWNIALASEKLQQAIALNDLPLYRQLEGDIAFYQGDFEKAHNLYMTVNNSPFASSLSYYLAVQTRMLLPNVNPNELIAWMDSAVAKSINIPSEAAAYLQESIDLKLQYGQYASAVKDYNTLYWALSGNVSDAYYYYREQAKFRAGDLDGALNDIETAIALDTLNAVYYAEEASVYLRLQDLANAQASAEKSISLDSQFAASYRLLGISLIRQQKKEAGCRELQKAKELGDPIVDRLIAENCEK